MKERFEKATVNEIAECLGIARQTASRKLHGHANFKLKEVDKLYQEYGITIHEIAESVNNNKNDFRKKD